MKPVTSDNWLILLINIWTLKSSLNKTAIRFWARQVYNFIYFFKIMPLLSSSCWCPLLHFQGIALLFSVIPSYSCWCSCIFVHGDASMSLFMLIIVIFGDTLITFKSQCTHDHWLKFRVHTLNEFFSLGGSFPGKLCNPVTRSPLVCVLHPV